MSLVLYPMRSTGDNVRAGSRAILQSVMTRRAINGYNRAFEED